MKNGRLNTKQTLKWGIVPHWEMILEVAYYHFGTYPSEIFLIPTFEDTLVYDIKFPTANYVLKTMRKNSRDSIKIAVEAQVCELVRAQGVPTPEIVILDKSEKIFPRTYFIMNKVQGVPFRKARLSANLNSFILNQIGETLRLIHLVQLKGFGRPDIKHFNLFGQINGCSLTWNEYLSGQLKSSLVYLHKFELINASLISDIENLFPKYEPLILETCESSLLHGDFTLEHIWIDDLNNSISSVIDFGDAVIGDPVWDFVSYDWENIEVFQCILRGYDPLFTLYKTFWSRLVLYRIIYTMSILVWGHNRKGINLQNFIATLQQCVEKAKKLV